MTIQIKTPNGPDRTIELSKAMEAHFNVPINHANTILNQINSGMYARWFAGKKDLVVIDFGANVGLTALYFLPACRKLFCVEPTPAHMNLLTELIEPNQGNCFAYYSPAALSDKIGTAVFMTGHSTENKITSNEGYGNNKINVETSPISEFIEYTNEPVIDFIKIDVEGIEIVALSQEQIDLSKGKVRTFFVECHPSQGYTLDGCREELKRRFEACGYNVEIEDYQTIIATYDC